MRSWARVLWMEVLSKAWIRLMHSATNQDRQQTLEKR